MKATSNGDEYQCSVCKGIFTAAWSDEEATAELERTFPGYAKHVSDLVCDDCYNKLLTRPAVLLMPKVLELKVVGGEV